MKDVQPKLKGQTATSEERTEGMTQIFHLPSLNEDSKQNGERTHPW